MKPWKTARYAPAGNRSGASARTSAVADACVVRQPIFGTDGDVVGYDVLYHCATIVPTFINPGLERLTSGRPAFMSFTREMLLARAYTLMPPYSVVVGVLRNVKPDDAVEQQCEELVDAGYTLALDDFVWSPHYRQLLELASIVRVDVSNQSPANLDELAQRLAPYDVRLLAERVETAETRATCAGLGYELFQGRFYAQPEMVASRALTSDEMNIVGAVNVMRDEWRTRSGLDTAPSGDLALGNLLHTVYSAAHGSVNREVFHLAVQRGRMCELLAGPSVWDGESRSLFLVGLLSLLDTISGIPMADLLAAMAPAPALRDALMSRAGPYAITLSLTEAYEQGAWVTVAQLAESLRMDAAHVGACYMESLAWTRDRLRPLATA